MAEPIQGMAELKRKLTALAQKRAKNVELNVGFIGGQKYETNGMPIAAVAALNEFGAVIQQPARETTVYRSLRADGKFNKKGRFVKKNASNYATTHHVESYSITIPARPFMRTTITENKSKWFHSFAELMNSSDAEPQNVLGTLGEKMVKDVQNSIGRWDTPPNAPSTVRKKRGRNKPLENTETMLRAVSFEIKG